MPGKPRAKGSQKQPQFAKLGRKPKSEDVAAERAKFFYALAKHKGACAEAAKELGYNKIALTRRAKELGLSPRVMAKEFTKYRLRSALIEGGGNAHEAVRRIGMHRLASRYGVDAKKYRQEPEKTAVQKIPKKEIPQHEQAVRLLASEFRIDRRGMRKLFAQSDCTPGWAEKQLRYLQELCEASSKHHKVNLAWRSYPELVALRPQEMSEAVQKEADAIASGAKQLQREQIQPAAKIPEIDVPRERSRMFGALLKHKGAAKRASEELGYREPEFIRRSAQLGVKPRIMKDAFTRYNLRKALIAKGGNVRAAAVAYGTTTSYFGSLMKRFGIDAERYRQAGAEPEKSQPWEVANRRRLPREQRKIMERAPLRVENTTIIIVAEGFKKGVYDDQHPPNDEALKIIERACNFDAQLIQKSVGVNYSVWHNWLVRRKLIGWVDRETRLARAQRAAEQEREKRQHMAELEKTMRQK